MVAVRSASVVFLAAAALILAACSGGSAQVDFSRQEQPTASAVTTPTSAGVVRLAIASVLSPLPTSDLYQQLADYLGEKLDRPVELVQGKTYAEINDLVKSGDVTLALVCTNPYLQGQEDFGMELLVAPQVGGETVYYSLLIVGGDSTAQSLAELRDSSFAFTDPLSNTGRLAPVYQLALMGENPDAFFGRTIFTYAHDSSIRAVAEGVVAAAAIDNLVFDYMAKTEPEIASRVKVIQKWGPFGINPFVVNPRLDAGLKRQLRTIFLEMDRDPRGKGILHDLLIDRFVVPDDSIYDGVREMRSYLREQGLGP